MYLRSDDRGPQMSKGIALRIAIFGGVALVLFGILFFRLWFLQILNGDQYLAEANNNRTREFRVSAPRGNILDREGDTLVTNRVSLALQVNPQKLPEDEARKREELTQLAELTHTTLPKLRRAMRKELKLAPGLPVTLRRDVGNYLVYYLEENKGRFPGVDVERVFVRRYPKETFAAHILGSVGEVTEEDLEEPRYKGLEAGDSIGQDGVEDTYDKFLRGTPGVTRIQVDAFGQPTAGGRLVSQRPVPGDNLELTIDGDVQSAGEAALASLRPARRLRDDGRPHGRNPRHGLVPDLRPDRLHEAAVAEPGRRPLPRRRLRPAHEPRDRRPLSERLDLQDHHRPGGARKRRSHARPK